MCVLLDESALKLGTRRHLFRQSMSVWGGSSRNRLPMIPFTLLAEDSQHTEPWVPKTKRPLDPVTWTTLHTADDGQGQCQEAQSRQHAEPKAGTERSQGTGPRQRVHFWSSYVHVRAGKHQHTSTLSYLSQLLSVRIQHSSSRPCITFLTRGLNPQSYFLQNNFRRFCKRTDTYMWIKRPTRCHFWYYIYFSFIGCSTCFGPPCAHLQELTTCSYVSDVLQSCNNG